MNAKTLNEVFNDLPLLKKTAWLNKIQQQMQALVPLHYKIKCSIKNDELVLLAENAALARRLSLYLPLLKPVLDKYNLAELKIIIVPNK